MRLQEFIKSILVIFLISPISTCSSVSEKNMRNLSSISEFSETSRHLVNVFSMLNDLYDRDIIQISSCTVLFQNSSEYKKYRRLSACLLRGTRLWKEEEKKIVVHFHIDNIKTVNLVLIWSSFSKLNLLKSFFKSQNTTNRLFVKIDPPETPSEVIDFLSNLPHPILVQESLFNVARLNMDEIDLEITPYTKDEFLVRLNVLQQKRSIYDVDVITNYSSDNRDDFFVLPASNLHE